MAKKQTVILTHGTLVPENATNFKHGELLVRHASANTETALYTKDGINGDTFVMFPSKDFIDLQNSILDGKIEDNKGKITAIENQLESIPVDKDNMTVTLTGDVTGSGTGTLGDGSISIEATVADDSHKHKSENISDSISALSACTSASTQLVQGKVANELKVKVGAIENQLESIPVDNDNMTVTLTGDVTGSGTTTLGAGSISITATVADDSHSHKSENISDSISALSACTSASTQLVQGKVANELKQKVTAIEEDLDSIPDNDKDMTVTLTGDVTGSGTTTLGAGSISITATVADDSHKHKSENISDSISALSACTSASTQLVQGKVANELKVKVTAIESDIETIVGEDNGKSIREIANSELAAQLITSGAAESMDTLQEIAQWIQEHPNDASEMNLKITENEKNIKSNSDAINAIENQLESIPVDNDNMAVTLTGDVTGSGTTTLGAGSISIEATVADDSHKHKSENISDSISALSACTSASTQLVQGKVANELKVKVGAIENQLESIPVDNDNMTVTLTGDVTGSGTTTLGAGSISITATVADDSHSHKSENISDSISALSACTSASTQLVQGKVANELKVKVGAIENQLESIPVDNDNMTVTLTGDVTGSGTTTLGAGSISITATVADDSHSHKSANISDSLSALSACTSASTQLVQGKVANELKQKVTAIEEVYIDTITVTNTNNNKITATKNGHEYVFNFDSMIIDGGTY